MAKKENKEVEQKVPAEQKFSLSSLLKSAEFSSMEKDFLNAYATKEEYTVAEAKALLQKKLKEVVK